MEFQRVLENVIVFNGIKEFKYDEIIKDDKLLNFVNRTLIFKLPSFVNKIIEEKGTIYIETDEFFNKNTVSLLNVSEELEKKFNDILY
ncbi:hypothetical protein [Flavobacterium sp.]|jgi:hypothetical protein|uniref:hypothetical protein n=1 Tax=Flavobacterium sp. TaxID=239 RepID=UPI0037C124B4